MLKLPVAILCPSYLAITALLPSPAAAGGPVVRVSSETAVSASVGQDSPQRQRELGEWLEAETPAGALQAPIRIPLTADEKRELERTDEDSGRLRVGRVVPLGKRVAFSTQDAAGLSRKVRRAAGGLLRATDDGGFVWAVALQSEGAAGLRVHLTEMSLPPGAELYFFSPNSEGFGPYTGRGPDGSGELWSNTVMDETGIVVLRHSGPADAAELSAASFVIADVGHVGPRFLAALAPVPESFCDKNASCIENATCYDQTPAETAKSAVALMQWVSGAFLYSCSGGLIADTDPGSQIPYFLSANHCVGRKRDAESLECFFQYQAACGVTMCPSKAGFPRTLGASVKATGNTGDFTLLQLAQSPPAGSAFLGWNNQPVAFTEGADLYRVSHPLASPQAFSEHSVSTSAVTCSGWPRGSWIYSRDVVGATQGGSSGSPVVNAAGEVVGQLSGGCGYNVGDVCDNVLNATVDGAFASYYAQVAPFLAPGTGGTNEVCNDGVDNDGDGATDCADPDCVGDPSCTASCDPVGSACSSNSQCCSGKCRGARGSMSCR